MGEATTQAQGEATGNGNGHADESLLARLRAEHAALSEKRTIDKPLPGYSSLVGRFKAVGREMITELTSRSELARLNGDDGNTGRNFDADLIGNTCIGVFERDDLGKLIPLNTLMDKWGDEPIVFDERLAEAVGADVGHYISEGVGEMRATVFAVLRVDEPDTGNDIRFGNLAREVWEWIRRGQEQTDSDF